VVTTASFAIDAVRKAFSPESSRRVTTSYETGNVNGSKGRKRPTLKLAHLINTCQLNRLSYPYTTYIALRHNHYLRSFAYRFIELCSPRLDEATIRAGLA
jgi:hypothetical protein